MIGKEYAIHLQILPDCAKRVEHLVSFNIMAKAESDRAHARKRAAERLGIWYSDADLLQIAAKIRQQQFIKSERKTVTRSLVIIEFNGRVIEVIYSRGTKQIVTIIREVKAVNNGQM